MRHHRSRLTEPPRPVEDPTIKRYFVYRLCDAADRCLYIGRSCNVPQRLRAHYNDRNKDWFRQVRSLDMEGPFTWNEAVRLEAVAIKQHRPLRNVVSHPDRWPLKQRPA